MARLSNSMAEVKARFEEDWKKPIAFYGKVVEQDEQPVEGANVSFVWNDLSPTGTSKTQTTSGAGGLFSLVGMTGRGLSVQVSKPGYYLQKRGGQFDFEYAREYEPSYYRPDPNNPVIFRLRRKGAGTELITSKYGVLPELEFSTPRDGSPVWVDFFGRRVGNRGQMELSAVKPPREDGAQVTGWSFRMTIADGGFIEHNDEFPFEAPEAGYEPTIAFQFEVGASDWTDLIRKQYYVAFGQPRRYGRIQIETRMFWGVRLEYAINPDGSRYLEPKETQYARPQHPPGSVEIVPGRPDLTRTNQ
jgi:hypothetical protein